MVLLALFGWQNLEQHPGVLSCDACHTQCTFIPNSGFNDSTVGVDDGDDDPENSGGDFGQDDQIGFNVIQAHKWYCYWVDSEHDRRSHREGWRIFFDLIMSASRATTGSGSTTSDGAEHTRLQVLSDEMATTKPCYYEYANGMSLYLTCCFRLFSH